MTKTIRNFAAGAAMLALAACGSSEQAPQRLTGIGATFPEPIYTKWFSEYQKLHNEIQINYQGQGSGAGIRQVTDGTVDFGASDQPMTDEQIAAFKTARSSGILHFPTVLGAVVPTYNLAGISAELNFTPAALAGIFLGKIKKWNDPALVSANPDVKLPSAEIVVIHRSDGSGTSFVLTDYLSKVSPEWAAGPGRGAAISWPVGLGGKGNPGVVGLVKQTPNSIGYTEMIFAIQNSMPAGRMQNAAGKFIKATPESATEAAASVPMTADFRVSITNASGDGAYPISSFTWLLIPDKIQDAAKRTVIVDFLKWMLGPGQSMAPALQFAALPAPVLEKELQAINNIQ
ncbi:MAG: phosphate ABC transporter substrate-binding protein PstS [Acidobacteriota bacterium]